MQSLRKSKKSKNSSMKKQQTDLLFTEPLMKDETFLSLFTFTRGKLVEIDGVPFLAKGSTIAMEYSQSEE